MPPLTGLGWQGQGFLPRFACTGSVTLFWSSSRVDFGNLVSSSETPVCGPLNVAQIHYHLPGSPGAKVRGLRARRWLPSPCPQAPRHSVCWGDAQGFCGSQAPQVSLSAHPWPRLEWQCQEVPRGFGFRGLRLPIFVFPVPNL